MCKRIVVRDHSELVFVVVSHEFPTGGVGHVTVGIVPSRVRAGMGLMQTPYQNWVNHQNQPCYGLPPFAFEERAL
jgi:hypothetical protein